MHIILFGVFMSLKKIYKLLPVLLPAMEAVVHHNTQSEEQAEAGTRDSWPPLDMDVATTHCILSVHLLGCPLFSIPGQHDPCRLQTKISPAPCKALPARPESWPQPCTQLSKS